MGDNDRSDRQDRGDRGDRGDRRDRDRDRDRDRNGGGDARRGGRGKRRESDCDFVDFKDIETLRKNCNQQWKIQSRKRNGSCSKCQRLLKAAVKRARFMALVPYVG